MLDGIKRIVLVLSDGMRPDAFTACGSPFVQELLAHSVYTLKAQTVMPSVTLPCHMSLFHSVPPERHGTVTNVHVPQVRPVKGIIDVLRAAGKFSACYYDWEELRDLNQAGTLTHCYMVRGHHLGWETAARMDFEDFKRYAECPGLPDFTFFYMGIVDEIGHKYGWMGPEYMEATRFSMDIAGEIAALLPEDTLLVVTADHGGIGRSHGSDAPECMTIPLFFYHRGLAPQELEGASIMDIAPTVVPLLGVAPDPEWEGRNRL